MKCQGMYFVFLVQGAVWDKLELTNGRNLALVYRFVFKCDVRI
jgi:hypothetical protein